MSSARPQTLPEIEAAVWRELARAAADRHHEWRTPVLATVDGDAADARTVVIREVDADQRLLRLFTDARSAKVAQLTAHPLGMLVLWSKRLGWQLRLRVRVDVHADGLAVASRWAKLKLSPAAQDYLSPLAPGSPLEDDAPTTSPLAHARGHFALLEAHIQAIDWLDLHADGHRRARFGDGDARWLAP